MNDPPVILLHGLGENRLQMARLASELRTNGRDTLNLGYPSRSRRIKELAELVWSRVREWLPASDRQLDFVTHSMGGIIARQIGADHPGAIRRAVMIAPPNRGTELVAFARRSRFLRWQIGPAGLELGCEEDSVPNRLGPPDFEVGVIAGSRPDNPFSSRLIPGEEDGRVGVARTTLEGMSDRIVLPYGHLSITMQSEVIRQSAHFLREGRFAHPDEDGHDHEDHPGTAS
jgi:pimeloyl-ACP methyl ester carboxylesterase